MSNSSQKPEKSTEQKAEPRISVHLAWMMGAVSPELIEKFREEEATVRVLEAKERLSVVDLSDVEAESKRRKKREVRRDKMKVKSSHPRPVQVDDQPVMLRSDVEDDWEDRDKVSSIGWFVLLGLVLCGMCGWAVYDVYQARPYVN